MSKKNTEAKFAESLKKQKFAGSEASAGNSAALQHQNQNQWQCWVRIRTPVRLRDSAICRKWIESLNRFVETGKIPTTRNHLQKLTDVSCF